MADTPIQIPVEIRAYLEDLILEAQVPVGDDKAKEELIQYLFERLDRFLAAKIVENMKPEDTETFIKMNEEQKSREDIDNFIRDHMQNAQEVFTRAFVDFRDFYLTAQANASAGSAQGQAAGQDMANKPADIPQQESSDDPSDNSGQGKLPN